MSEGDYRIALKTIRQSFPYLYEFDMFRLTELEEFREIVVLAASEPIDVLSTAQTRRFDLAIGTSETSEHLLQMLDLIEEVYRQGPAEIDALIEGTRRVNSDDLPILEFRTLRNRFRKFKSEN